MPMGPSGRRQRVSVPKMGKKKPHPEVRLGGGPVYLAAWRGWGGGGIATDEVAIFLAAISTMRWISISAVRRLILASSTSLERSNVSRFSFSLLVRVWEMAISRSPTSLASLSAWAL